MPGPRETKRVLIVVRTYPTPAHKGVEVSCTAGVCDGKWIRLFPVPYRFLDPDKRFSKYQWIECSVVRAAGDARVESYTLDRDSIRIVSPQISTAEAWAARKDVVFPLRSQSLCGLRAQSLQSLGLFRPKAIKRLVIEPVSPNWTADQLAALRQPLMFDKAPRAELEKVPFNFKYVFQCDEPKCRGHRAMCTDWEMGASWHRWRNEYGNDWERKFRERYECDMVGRNDTHFYVGTVHKHPRNWVIVGLFYPPKTPQGSLFRAD